MGDRRPPYPERTLHRPSPEAGAHCPAAALAFVAAYESAQEVAFNHALYPAEERAAMRRLTALHAPKLDCYLADAHHPRAALHRLFLARAGRYALSPMETEVVSCSAERVIFVERGFERHYADRSADDVYGNYARVVLARRKRGNRFRVAAVVREQTKEGPGCGDGLRRSAPGRFLATDCQRDQWAALAASGCFRDMPPANPCRQRLRDALYALERCGIATPYGPSLPSTGVPSTAVPSTGASPPPP